MLPRNRMEDRQADRLFLILALINAAMLLLGALSMALETWQQALVTTFGPFA